MELYEDLRRAGDEEPRDLVIQHRQDQRAVLTLADPGRLNSLSAGLNLQLQQKLDEIAGDPGVRTVIITGKDPAFSAGGDLKMIRDGNEAIRDAEDPSDTTDPWRWIRRQFGGVARTIATTDKLFVAAINGPAAGVGLAFALACDVLVASERAVLVPAFGKLGLVPEVGTSWLLTRRLGYHGAMAYYLGGRQISAEKGLELGLVQEVVAHDQLMTAAATWCERAEQMPAHAVEMAKALLRGAADASWEESLKLEEFAEANCFSTVALGHAAQGLLATSHTESGTGH
jgi:2-(1,2-epoxy-1,2-dihydrophenyl)acetyl-CoA isomerase